MRRDSARFAEGFSWDGRGSAQILSALADCSAGCSSHPTEPATVAEQRALPAESIGAAHDRAVPLPVLGLLLLIAACWGGQPVSMKYSFTHVPPLATACLRFLIGIGVIVACARVQRIPLRPPPGEAIRLLCLGALFCTQICLLYAGGNLTASARQSLFINSHPLFVPLMAHLFLTGDRLTVEKVGGTLLAFTGFLVALGESGPLASGGQFAGDLLVLASAVLLAGKAVYTSALVRSIEPYRVLFWQMVIAVPCFFALSAWIDGSRPWRWSPLAAAAIGYQGIVVAGFCFVVWTFLLRHYAPTRLSVVMFATPLFGVALSAWLLGEPVSAVLVAGGALVLAGIALVNRASAGRPAPEST